MLSIIAKSTVDNQQVRLEICQLAVAFYNLELILMLLKKIIICPDIRQVCPMAYPHWLLVQIINLGILHGQQERGVCCDNKLASKKPNGIFYELYQFLLALR